MRTRSGQSGSVAIGGHSREMTLLAVSVSFAVISAISDGIRLNVPMLVSRMPSTRSSARLTTPWSCVMSSLGAR